MISTWLEIAVNALLSLDQDDDRRIWVILDELPTLHQVPSLQPGLAESRQFGGCFVLGVQVASALRDLYGRNGAETISGLCGTRVVFAAPDRDTAQWSADSLGRSEIEEVAEGVSYGADPYRDGVTLTPKRELQSLALPSEITRLPNLTGYLKLPGPFPVARIELKYVKRPKVSPRFVPRGQQGGRPASGHGGNSRAGKRSGGGGFQGGRSRAGSGHWGRGGAGGNRDGRASGAGGRAGPVGAGPAGRAVQGRGRKIAQARRRSRQRSVPRRPKRTRQRSGTTRWRKKRTRTPCEGTRSSGPDGRLGRRRRLGRPRASRTTNATATTRKTTPNTGTRAPGRARARPRWGFKGPVDPETFKALLAGQVPDGPQLGKRGRDGSVSHRPGRDLTFSAPKSVSLVALVGGDERIVAAHDRAVKRALDWVERNAAETRLSDPATRQMVRAKGQKTVAATFRHDTSRNLDPQLHSHAVLANMLLGGDGKWRTMANESLYRSQKLIGMIYRNELAAVLTRLGYGIEKSHADGRFEIAGVSRESDRGVLDPARRDPGGDERTGPGRYRGESASGRTRRAHDPCPQARRGQGRAARALETTGRGDGVRTRKGGRECPGRR